MSRRNSKRFDGNAWYEQYMIARTSEALKEKDRSFSLLHAKDSDQSLICYVQHCAAEMGYTPTAKEVIGGAYIAQRFGDWSVVLKKAGLPINHTCPALTKRYIFLKEREIQAELHRQERSSILAKRAAKHTQRTQKNKSEDA